MDADGVNQSHLTEDEVVAYLGHELTAEPLRRVASPGLYCQHPE